MAFVVEDGTGLETANAYITVAFMRSYWTDVGVTLTQTDPELQVAIVKATRYADNRYDGRWLGMREFADVQALSWPRCYVHKPDSCEYYTGVPLPLQKALAEYARRALTIELQPVPTTDPFVTKTKSKAGPLETEQERVPGVQIFIPVPAGDRQLRGLLLCGNYCYR